MKSRIHPASRPVVFRDRAAGAAFLTRSTADSDQRVTWEDGRSYPVIDVETSSASHPFYTGTRQVLDQAKPDRTVQPPLRQRSARHRGVKPRSSWPVSEAVSSRPGVRALDHSPGCGFPGTRSDDLSFTYTWMTR